MMLFLKFKIDYFRLKVIINQLAKASGLQLNWAAKKFNISACGGRSRKHIISMVASN
jgi:hypothetical protein